MYLVNIAKGTLLGAIIVCSFLLVRDGKLEKDKQLYLVLTAIMSLIMYVIGTYFW